MQSVRLEFVDPDEPEPVEADDERAATSSLGEFDLGKEVKINLEVSGENDQDTAFWFILPFSFIIT